MRRVGLTGLLVLCLLPAAQAEPVDDLLALDLEQLLQLEVTGASWRPTPLRDAAASITVFTADDLRRLGLRYLEELLDWVPGVYGARTETSGSDHRLVLRGNASTAGGTLIAIDGQRTNTLQTYKPFSVVRHWPLALLERVEIIRGPGTARFGGGPSDAVINLITRKSGNALGLGAGGDGQAYGDLSWHGGNGDWRWGLNAYAVDSEGYEYRDLFDRRGRFDRIRDPEQGHSLVFDLGWRQHRLQAFRHYSARNGYYSLNGSLTAEPINQLSLDWLRYEGQADTGGWQWQWHVSAVRQQFAVATVQQPQGSGPFQQADLLLRGDLTHHAVSLGLSLQRRLGAHALTLGMEGQRGRTVEADLSCNYLPAAPYSYLGGFEPLGLRFVAAGAEERFAAVYVEDDWQIGGAQRLVAGLRHDRYRESGSATSPRLAWIWNTGPETTLKLLYQEAFFAATLGQLYLQNNPVVLGNPDLRPTRVRSLEVIYSWQLPHGLVSATWYRRKAADLIALVGLAGAVSHLENSGRQDSNGLEFASQWALGEHWRLDLNASTVFSDRYVLPATLTEQPPASFFARDTASLSLSWADERWSAELGGHWHSREPLQPAGDAWTWQTHLRYRWNPRWAATLHIDNLFDARRFDTEVAGGLGVDGNGEVVRGLPRPGREWRLGVEYRWE